ncbi:SCY1 protein kinase [Phakopsora pachyrhizi]|uniref:SCY1 protein kinase n=1 Tax=Phakopsora pachyrhizi TaxID=170000 RepID=A0AAV0AS14_PHAPC|nr:SCY1 protein kinase [Phakopsora pachyrhizi]CAH7670615.1 SCY1 protein kinase [Phakopsora pachyrhizi]CAH7674026.1 SCY1 protein kinase [Phakopsora pachyrhizi]
MHTYLRAAASYLDRSNISASYTALPNPASGCPNPQSSAAASNWSPQARVGLWSVVRATHNTTDKLVSVWTFEKRLESTLTGVVSWGGGGSQSKAPIDKVLDVLKKEVSSLSRLRHPCILEVVEPLEETRSTMVFATEPVTGSLRDAIDQMSSNYSSSTKPSGNTLELDEVETQKGLLQLGKGLQFLHDSARLVHSNLTPDSIVINSKGDWKISGFGLSLYLKHQDGQDVRWSFPDFDHRLPEAVQRNFDYIAPEYCLDEHLTTSNDMYSLGCILHSIHTLNGPPFKNHNSIDNVRRNIEDLSVLRMAWSRVADDVQEVLSQLITRSPSTRLTAASFLSSRYFSSNVLVSTLAFLDRDTFNSKQKEEQIQFMKGLLRILPKFSPKVIKRKILPSLLEETRKNILLPFLLPNIFYIANEMDTEEFRNELLPHLTPLFSIKDPPQSILTLLDNLSLFQNKSTPQVFREEVMPLVYFALESDVPALQEKSLKVIPSLCETLEYTHVKQVLFPKVTMVFSKTTLLSIKVNTLICFHSMVKILDKYTLTEKLVPLLARIKTKEPAVMIATLAVHEEMGKKVEINAIATLILPQLWSMSIGPLLNLDQFKRFMNSIDQLSCRVREEHTKHLVEARRLEESTARTAASNSIATQSRADEVVDFETLVRGRQTSSSSVIPEMSNTSPTNNAWGLDDGIGGRLTTSANSLPNWNSESSTKIKNSLSPSSAGMSFNYSTQPMQPNIIRAHSSLSLASSYPNPQSPTSNPIVSQPSTGTIDSSFIRPNSAIGFENSKPHDHSSSDFGSSSVFVGLPPLKPQTSSLNQLIGSSNQLNSNFGNNNSSGGFNKNINSNLNNWNVIKPQAISQRQNEPKGSSSKANLADFDPFA